MPKSIFLCQLLSLFFLFSSLFLACNSTNKRQKQLQGRWEIADAEFDETPAIDRLKGFYIQFSGKDSLTTNMTATADTINSRYELEEEQIIQKMGEENQIFNIIELVDTQLVLTTNMRGHEFKLLFKKLK